MTSKRRLLWMSTILLAAIATYSSLPEGLMPRGSSQLDVIRVVIPRNGGKKDQWNIEEKDRLTRMECFLTQHRRGWKRLWGEGQGMHYFAQCIDGDGSSFWIAIQQEDGPKDPYWLLGRVDAPVFEYERMETLRVPRKDYLELLDILNIGK